MNTSLLPAEKDPMGAAIADFIIAKSRQITRIFFSVR